MGWVVDTLTVSLDTELKPWLGITGATYDALLGVLLTAAMEQADGFMNNEFVTAAGVDIAIPSSVKTGVMEWCRRAWERRPADATMQRARDVAVAFRMTADILDEIAQRYWMPWRLVPLPS